MIPVATPLSYKPDEPFTRLLKQQDPTPIRFVVTKRSVGSDKIHVTYLTLAGVPTHPVQLEPVLVAIGSPWGVVNSRRIA